MRTNSPRQPLFDPVAVAIAVPQAPLPRALITSARNGSVRVPPNVLPAENLLALICVSAGTF